MEIFQQRLRQIRKSNGLTQEEAAKQLQIPYRSYRRYETGEAEPGISTAAAIADFFNVSLDYLSGLTQDTSLRR